MPRRADSELAAYLAELGTIRALGKRTIPGRPARIALLRELTDGLSLSGRLTLPGEWRQKLASTRADLERRLPVSQPRPEPAPPRALSP